LKSRFEIFKNAWFRVKRFSVYSNHGFVINRNKVFNISRFYGVEVSRNQYFEKASVSEFKNRKISRFRIFDISVF
jgi:hypothetical protein